MSRMEFLPFPARAASDTNLSASDFRVLGAIAKHDRRGANGRGCFASAKTLAEAAHCSLRSTERAISKLQGLGYVASERSQDDARRMVLRIVYEEKTAKNGGYNDEDNRHPETRYPPTSNEVSEQFQSAIPSKQRHKHISRSEEADPAEAAPFLRNSAGMNEETNPRRWMECISEGEPVGRYLQVAESLMRRMTNVERGMHIQIMVAVQECFQHGDTEHQWAGRLMNELAWLNDCEAYDEANGAANDPRR